MGVMCFISPRQDCSTTSSITNHIVMSSIIFCITPAYQQYNNKENYICSPPFRLFLVMWVEKVHSRV